MALGTNGDRLMSDINVTPFVDVMLVLLVIFMVTAPMMMQGVDVALPETTSQPLVAKKENLIITINKKSEIYINNYQVTIDFLQEKLKKILDVKVDHSFPDRSLKRTKRDYKIRNQKVIRIYNRLCQLADYMPEDI